MYNPKIIMDMVEFSIFIGSLLCIGIIATILSARPKVSEFFKRRSPNRPLHDPVPGGVSCCQNLAFISVCLLVTLIAISPGFVPWIVIGSMPSLTTNVREK